VLGYSEGAGGGEQGPRSGWRVFVSLRSYAQRRLSMLGGTKLIRGKTREGGIG